MTRSFTLLLALLLSVGSVSEAQHAHRPDAGAGPGASATSDALVIQRVDGTETRVAATDLAALVATTVDAEDHGTRVRFTR